MRESESEINLSSGWSSQMSIVHEVRLNNVVDNLTLTPLFLLPLPSSTHSAFHIVRCRGPCLDRCHRVEIGI